MQPLTLQGEPSDGQTHRRRSFSKKVGQTWESKHTILSKGIGIDQQSKVVSGKTSAAQIFDYDGNTDTPGHHGQPMMAVEGPSADVRRAVEVARLLQSQKEMEKHKRCRSAGLPLCGVAGQTLLKARAKFTATVKDICAARAVKECEAGGCGNGKDALMNGFLFFLLRGATADEQTAGAETVSLKLLHVSHVAGGLKQFSPTFMVCQFIVPQDFSDVVDPGSEHDKGKGADTDATWWPKNLFTSMKAMKATPDFQEYHELLLEMLRQEKAKVWYLQVYELVNTSTPRLFMPAEMCLRKCQLPPAIVLRRSAGLERPMKTAAQRLMEELIGCIKSLIDH